MDWGSPEGSAVKELPDEERCPFYARAWGCRCEKKRGHEKEEGAKALCVNGGDGFAPGFDPTAFSKDPTRL